MKPLLMPHFHIKSKPIERQRYRLRTLGSSKGVRREGLLAGFIMHAVNVVIVVALG